MKGLQEGDERSIAKSGTSVAIGRVENSHDTSTSRAMDPSAKRFVKGGLEWLAAATYNQRGDLLTPSLPQPVKFPG